MAQERLGAAQATEAFCSSAEELGLLGDMLFSRADGAAAASTLLKGSKLEVHMVHGLVAVLNSSLKVGKLRGCLQKAGAVVSSTDRTVWLHWWLYLLGGTKAPASLEVQSKFSLALFKSAEKEAGAAKTRLAEARRKKATEEQAAAVREERIAREEEAACQPFVLPANVQEKPGCVTTSATLPSPPTSNYDSGSDADPSASPTREAAAPPHPVADAMAAATSLAELATVAAAAPVLELEEEGGALREVARSRRRSSACERSASVRMRCAGSCARSWRQRAQRAKR